MVKCNFAELLATKKLKISDVVRDTGINRKTATRLFHETNSRIDYETLEKVCRYLDCEIGDLLVLEDD
ncbi:helix-turn-helix transcriptional regulator [Pseudidiomarina sp. CB1]|uniref:helix-turn-helix domain-containing protein n=1 Tax=Pseudidiomarina sp. CB1 TaxID=2972484 RepID=UPI002163C8D7|nr:helix-turn-helix transcriptional regulator [Pseudidiomarina sp. CB1]